MKRSALEQYALAVVLGATASASAQVPFSLDTTFRTAIQSQYVNSLALLPDGKLLLSGMIRFPGDINARGSARLLASGQRDLSFTYFTGGGKLTPWNDNFYVSVGQEVRRLFPTGQTDASFVGLSASPYFSSLQGGDYHVYPDGRVLISGQHILSDAVRGFEGLYNLIWFSNTGYLDTTRIHRKGNGVVYRFKELPNGQFICSGTCTQFDGHAVDRIFRVHADGSTDTTFHTGVYTGIVGGYIPLDDGRVYVSGRFRRSAAPTDTLLLVRFMLDGTLDPSFSIPNFSLGALPSHPSAVVSFLYPWDDGKFIATGQFQYVNGLPRRGICMLDSTGAVMDAFDDCGVGIFVDQGFTNATIEYVVRDTVNNYLYVNGAYTGYDDGTTNDPLQRFVTRLHLGDITTSQEQVQGREAGVRLFPNPSSGPVTLALEQLPQDAVLVVRDALGREVQHQRVSGHYTTFTFSHSGVYLVELWNGIERTSSQRLVVE